VNEFTFETRESAFIAGMASMIKLPLVEVTAPDGARSLWVAAVAQEEAVAAVARVVPANYSIRLLRHRLTLHRKSIDLQPGEVARVRL
jgi:hypothetical protein